MFQQILDASSTLVDFLPNLARFIIEPFYDVLIEFGVGEAGIPEKILDLAFGLIDRLFGDILWNSVQLSVYQVSLLELVLGPGLILIIVISVIYFILNVVDTVIPL